jgi:hypothetical protein
MAATNEGLHNLTVRGIGEFKRLFIIFAYLWVIFGLFALNQAIIKHNLSFLTHGFALINALIFAKVMLIAEDLKLGDRFQRKPLVYPVVYKTILFSIVLILFHILEDAVVALWHGKSGVDSFPDVNGEAFLGALCVWGILSISLLPFFTVREIARVMGEHELWDLFFHRGTMAGVSPDGLAGE